MAFQVSPGVAVSEVDASTTIPTTAVSDAGFAGFFSKGPANKIVKVSSENELVEIFGEPNSNNASNWLCVASFLAYGGDIQIIRLLDGTAANSFAGTDTVGVDPLVKNDEDWDTTEAQATIDSTVTFVARSPGKWGDGLKVHVLDKDYSGTEQVPDLSDDDSRHILITMTTGDTTVEVERFEWLSADIAGKGADGANNYWKDVLNRDSQYVFAAEATPSLNATSNDLTEGADSNQTSTRSAGYMDGSGGNGLFSDTEQVNLSLIITGDESNVGDAAGELATARKDCVAFYSPSLASQTSNKSQSEKASLVISSARGNNSYSFMDSGWKKMYDKYNDTWRFVPLNGDIAGLCVATDKNREPWYSPAGFNRGQIRNCAGLLFDPNQSSRDSLYQKNINPVSSFPGQGFVLFGDKTRQTKPSAFDRLNVRRLFIVLEKTISEAAKYSLFEFNDEFTRSQFTSLINPYLRDIKGRRGIHDYLVVCDESNNTSAIVDANQFVGDIFIKPTRSINFIQLNFVAVRTGVSFSEVVGAV